MGEIDNVDETGHVDLDHVLRFDREENLGAYLDRQVYGRDFTVHTECAIDYIRDGTGKTYSVTHYRKIRRPISSAYELPTGDAA